MINRILTVLAHEDDETLGCGGVIHKFSEKGILVCSLIPIRRIELQAMEARKILGVSSVIYGEYEDNKLDKYSLADICKWVEDGIKVYKPDVIITHHANCMNQDHRVLFQACSIATRPVKHRIQLLSCEVLSSTGYLRPCGFEPNFYVSLGIDDLNAKLSAIQTYQTELRPDRSPDVVRSLALLRGAESGTDYAEGFMLIRGFEDII